MEFLENILGGKRKRQEEILSELGIEKKIRDGRLREVFFPPKDKKVDIATVENETFLELLESGRFDEVLRENTGGDDTYTSYDLYIEAGEDLVIQTNTWQPEWGPYHGDLPIRILEDLNQMGFKYDSHGLDERVDPSWWRGWGLYKRKDK